MSYTNDRVQSELLAKFLSGEASPEEAVVVADWMAAEKTPEGYKELLDLWNANEDYKTPHHEEVWAAFQSALQTKNVSQRPPRRLVFLAAASIILIAGLFITMYWLAGSTPGNELKRTRMAAGSQNLGRNLPDGSDMVLYKGSAASYTPSFNTTSRELELSGRGYFKVVPDKSRPFIISVGRLKIKVVGTSFDVEEFGSEVRVQVETGIVELYTDQSKVSVHKGQTCLYDPVKNSFSVSDSVDRNSFSYATRRFSFNDLPLPEVVELLEAAFDVKIEVDGRGLQNCRLTAEFENKSLQYMVEIISATVNSSYSITGNNIKIYGKGCE
jgi:transmembrane sensor